MTSALCKIFGTPAQSRYDIPMLALFALYAEVVVVTLVGIILLLLGWIARIEIRMRRFMRGGNAQDLEGVIHRVLKEHESMAEVTQALEHSSSELRKLLTEAVRGVSVVRFNALSGDTSGKQSFAAAIVSEKGDGIVLSSLHARDNARMYAKPLKNFISEHELTEEEKRAIVEARKRYVAPVAVPAPARKK